MSELFHQTNGTCNHGYWPHDCALCLKRPGECDYGSCTEPATERVGVRPMCARHAPDATYKLAEDVARQMGGSVRDAGEFWEIAA